MSRDPALPEYVEMGEHTYYDPHDVRFITWVPGEKIIIGKYCSLASGATFCTGGNHCTETVSTYPFDNFFLGRANPTRTYKGTRDTVVGHDVWVGYRAHVLGGVRVGHGAVLGTRAVVLSDVPPYGIVVGNPARLVRYRFSKPMVERLLRIAWWDWPEARVRENVEWFYRPVQEFVEHFDPQGGSCGHGRTDRDDPPRTDDRPAAAA